LNHEILQIERSDMARNAVNIAPESVMLAI
jgi:hypothetical protein